MILPFIIIGLLHKKLTKYRIYFSYLLFGLIFWYVGFRTDQGRYVLPYLPIFSLIAVLTLNEIKNSKIKMFCLIVIITICAISLPYRFLANAKYIPVIAGVEKKGIFLSRNLNFNYGDFYDTDGYFKENVKNTDRVLLYGFHNLYYVDFPFVHESWVDSNDRFTHIAVQNENLPERFRFWPLVYYNPVNSVRVYYMGQEWAY